MSLPADLVEAATRAWMWIPDVATRIETDEYLLVHFPEWFEAGLEVFRFEPQREPGVVARELLARARETGVEELWWWVLLDAPPGSDELVVSLGGVINETLDVLALDLGPGVPDLGADGVEVRWVTDPATMRDTHTVSTVVFGGSMPPRAQLEADAAVTATDTVEGRGGGVVAYLDGAPAGTAGLSLVDGVARLWGGSVVEEHRGRGIYRALLRARIEYAVERGATMGLVRARVESSAPILRRAGFVAYGRQRGYAVPLT